MEPFGHTYEWRLSAGGAPVEVQCSHELFDENSGVMCSLRIPLGLDASMRYSPSGTIEIAPDVGGIDLDLETHLIEIGGSALAARPY